MSTTVSYKGATIATVSNDTKTLLTEGKYLEDDLTLVDVSGGGAVLTTKNISANGTYNASSDSADGYSSVTVAVPASAVDSGTKNITANGNNQDVVGYAAVNVNVPNSYSAADEGKVVSNGALVAQTSDTVTENDTYDTTLINSLTVAVSGGYTDNELASGSEPSGDLNISVEIMSQVFYKRNNITKITHTGGGVGARALQEATGIKTFIGKGTTYFYAQVFKGCSNLEAVDVGTSYNWRFETENFAQCGKLEMLVLRGSSVIALNSTNTFTSTPFASSGTGGTLYVPNDLISSYQAASNWSTILGYTNNSIKSIESTHTDPNAPIDLTLYYADGTLIPT